jgi:hypothetical protein
VEKMSKGVCPYCHKTIAINLEENVETCSYCQKEYLPRQANKLFGLMYSQYSSNGNIALNISRNYEKALEEYQKLLALDDESIEGIFGLANATLSVAKIDENVVDNIINLLNEKREKMLANTELYQEIAGNLMALATRMDSFLEQSKTLLSNNNNFRDQGAKNRYHQIVISALSLWQYISGVFNDYFRDYSVEINIIKNRINALQQEEIDVNTLNVLSPGDSQYLKLLNSHIFESRIGLFKWRLIVAFLQIVFVIGAIIGFSIMMANYENNPFPGLIVFGSFAFLFIIANIVGRIFKKLLAK